MNLLDNGSETEYELKPTIIRVGGALLKKPTSFIDIFDIERMIWKRIENNMHCKRVYTQSIIVNGKLIVIGGEVFHKDINKKGEDDNNENKIKPIITPAGSNKDLMGNIDSIDSPMSVAISHKSANSGSRRGSITDEEDEKGIYLIHFSYSFI